MAGFKEAQTNPLIDTNGKNHAKLAVVAMAEVELGLGTSLHAAWDRSMKRKGSRIVEIKMKQASVRGMRRSHHEAFSLSCC